MACQNRGMDLSGIDTARLSLDPLTMADAEALHDLFISPGVRRFLWDDQVVPFEQAVEVIEISNNLRDKHGFGLWGVRLLQRRDLIGFCGYWYFRDPPELEILYGLAPQYWGRGYTTEAAAAMLRYGFEVLGFHEVRGSTDAPNVASVRVMEKIGMRCERRQSVNGLNTLFFSMSRAALPNHGAAYALRRSQPA